MLEARENCQEIDLFTASYFMNFTYTAVSEYTNIGIDPACNQKKNGNKNGRPRQEP